MKPKTTESDDERRIKLAGLRRSVGDAPSSRLGDRQSGRSDHLAGEIDGSAHDPGMLADLADPDEVVLFEQLDGRAKQETTLGLASIGHFGDGFDHSATSASYLIEGALEGGAGNAATAVFSVDKDAGDSPVGSWRWVLFNRLACV